MKTSNAPVERPAARGRSIASKAIGQRVMRPNLAMRSAMASMMIAMVSSMKGQLLAQELLNVSKQAVVRLVETLNVHAANNAKRASVSGRSASMSPVLMATPAKMADARIFACVCNVL
jgi:hypothetical protein